MATQGATYTAQVLPPGQAGTVQTLDLMAKYVRDSQVDVGLIDFANTVLQAFNVPPRNDKAKIDAIFAYVKAAVTFRKDPYDAELVRDARRTLQAGYGDCDDIAVLLASLLACVGECPRFAIMKMSKSSPDWEHVYVEVLLGNKWLPLDTTRDPKQGKTYPGWESYYGQKAVYTIFQDGIPSTVGYANWPKFARSMTMGRLGDDYGYSGDGGGYDDSGYDPSLDFSGDTSTNDPWNPGFAAGDADASGQEMNSLGTTEFFEQDGSFTVYSADGSMENWDQNGNVNTLSEVNPDGTITYYDVKAGTSYVEDPYGNVVSQKPATPVQKAKAQAVQKAGPASSSGGGGGGGVPLGSSGGQKAPGQAPDTTASLINSITKALQGVVGAVTGNPVTGSTLTAQQLATLRAQQTSTAALGGLSLTTLLLIGGGIYLLSKK